MVYTLDRLFDALSSKGTELLEAAENQLEAQGEIIVRLGILLDEQVTTSRLYITATIQNERILRTLSSARLNLEQAETDARVVIDSHQASIQTVENQHARLQRLRQSIDLALGLPVKKF